MDSAEQIENNILTACANWNDDAPQLTNILLADIGLAILALTKAVEGLNK